MRKTESMRQQAGDNRKQLWSQGQRYMKEQIGMKIP